MASTSCFHGCTHMFIHMHTPCTHIRFGTGIRGERPIHNNSKQQKSKKRPNEEGKITIQLKYRRKQIEEHKGMWEILSVLIYWHSPHSGRAILLKMISSFKEIPSTFQSHSSESQKNLNPYRNKKKPSNIQSNS